MSVYRNCEELSIYLFHKILDTGNMMFLVKGYDDGEQLKHPIKEDLNKVWEAIYTEYTDLTDDNQSLHYFKLKTRVVFLETRMYFVNFLILQMAERDMDEQTQKEYADAIREWDVPYVGDEKKISELEKAQRYIKLSTNELGIKKKELENMNSAEKPVPLIKQVVMAEQALGRNQIDPKTTSVAKWVYMMDVIRKQNEERKKNMGRGK